MYVWGKWSEVILIVLYVIKIVYIKFSVLNDFVYLDLGKF